MIVGIVIGSGIFFKSDDVLIYTNGNVVLGVIVFCVASIAIIFGSLAIAQLAMRTDEPGGIVSYAEKFVGMGTACSLRVCITSSDHLSPMRASMLRTGHSGKSNSLSMG